MDALDADRDSDEYECMKRTKDTGCFACCQKMLGVGVQRRWCISNFDFLAWSLCQMLLFLLSHCILLLCPTWQDMPIDRGVHTKSYGTVPDNSILLYRAKEDSCLYLFILCIRCVKFFTEILMAIKASMILDNKPNTLGSTELLS